MQNSFYQDFINKHPLYQKIKYRSNECSLDTLLHPILIYSQAVIDRYLLEGKKRIVIVLPDNETNILPMVVAKYFASLQENPDYAHNVFEDIEEGQHLKLGKSVIEFLRIDKEDNTITFYAGRPTKTSSATKYISPLQNYYLYFERTNAELTKEETFLRERKAIKSKLATDGIVDFDLLSLKRTTLNKTIAVLSLKNEFKEYLNNFYIYGRKFSEAVTYGEFDLEESSLVRLYNTGKLDCIPSITVSSKLNELSNIVTNYEFSKNIEAIIVTQSKYNDIVNNTDELKKCLRKKVPFIVFASESEFETFPVLSELGFEFLHWDKELLDKCGFSSDQHIEDSTSIFHRLSRRTYAAAVHKSASVTFRFDELKVAVNLIRNLLRTSIEGNDRIKQIAFSLNRFYKQILDMLSPNQDEISNELINRLFEIEDIWNQISASYKETDFENSINKIFELLEFCLSVDVWPKAKALQNVLVLDIQGDCCIIIPDRYLYKEHLTRYIDSCFDDKKITVLYPNEFYNAVKDSTKQYNTVIVTFFDSSEYAKIKSTFCYDKILYLLYDFENTWRSHYISRYHECLPSEAIRRSAMAMGISNINEDGSLEWKETEDVYTEINDYNFERNIVKVVLGNRNCSANQADSVECIPVIFNQNTVGYFSPTHSLIEISLMCSGDLEKPVKKEARKIVQGDIILIRQSGRDIVLEKADELMLIKGRAGLRAKSEKWVCALQKFAQGKDIDEVLSAMLKNGAECTAQQIRYWLVGDTICPEKINVLHAISVICPEELPQEVINEVYEAGMQVQEFHREAGRWLSRELKNKAQEIKAIYDSGKYSGFIDGIGEIQVYVIEEILDKEYVNRGKVNRVEVII